VLSVGGNDVREILGAMHELPAKIAAFHDNYPQIAQACEASGARVIIMLQYRPDLATDLQHYGVYRAIEAGIPGPGDRVAKLNQLMQTIYPNVLATAAAKGWDVLDLPNSFDIHDTSLYRCQIEPSARGGALIAELIAHTVLNRPVVAGAKLAALISKAPLSRVGILETPLVPAELLGGVEGGVSPDSWCIDVDLVPESQQLEPHLSTGGTAVEQQFDADLAAALAASVADHQAAHCTLVLDSSFSTQRCNLQRRGAALVEGLEAGKPRPGFVHQLNLFDQFHSSFNEMILEHATPSAICGYIACALARQLNLRLRPADGSCAAFSQLTNLDALVEELRDGEALKPELRAAMIHIHDSRERWIEAHADQFPDESTRREYLSAWVANYEISDYLRSQPAADVDGVVFLRFNQWPERASATHEEAARLAVEEARFGGSADGDKADVTRQTDASDNYSMFVVEDFGADANDIEGPALRTPAEWLGARVSDDGRRRRPKVFVLDLNGHFCVAVPHAKGKKVPGGLECCLTLLNTTDGSYLGGSGGLVSSVAFDLAFPPISCG